MWKPRTSCIGIATSTRPIAIPRYVSRILKAISIVIWPTDSFQGDVDPKVILGKHGCVNRVTAELTAVDGADTWRSYNVTSVLVSDSAV